MCRSDRQFAARTAAAHLITATCASSINNAASQPDLHVDSQPPTAGRGCTLCVRKWRLAAPFAQSLLGSLQAEHGPLEGGEIGIGFHRERSKGVGQGK